MKILIAEDEYISRILLTGILSAYGSCFVATNGEEAVALLNRSFETKERFDLVCLDIMLPDFDGHEVLRRIRTMERQRDIYGMDAVKVIMTTALDDAENIMAAFVKGRCEAYLTKPIDKDKLVQHLIDLRLI